MAVFQRLRLALARWLWPRLGELESMAQRLADSERRLRNIADNVPVLIGYIDTGMRFQFCNETFRLWANLAPEQLLGRRILDMNDAHSKGRFAMLKPYLERALAGERVELEIAPTPGGHQRWLQATFVPERDAAGAVIGFYLLASDVTALKSVEQRLSDMARYDALTGLPNRYQFNEKLHEALRRSNRSRNPMALAFLDIDRFKIINDTLGHGCGDEVLKEFARRLRRSVREIDTVARLAGDEFVIVLEDLSGQDALAQIGEKILEAMIPPFVLSGGPLDVRTSIGLAYVDEPDVLATDLLECADAALYQAKREGRATCRCKHYQGALTTPAG
ncbi:MAG: GGDEF domain-containing protein [Pseudomonadota bacterium]